MVGLDRDQVVAAIKKIVIEDCDKDVLPEDIAANERLIGGSLELDSLDALQICMSVKSIYGVRIEGGPESRRALQSVDTLVDTILASAGGQN